jgi:energy-converting hydrogenase A subunit M
MTNEEIINILRKEVDNYDYSLFHSDLEQADKEILQKKIDALDKVIKALEQQHILDKIRAEIEQVAFKDVNGSKYIFVNRVNQIIDKYKAESER